MNKIFKTTAIVMALCTLAACGGKGADKQATTTQKEAEKVKVQVLQSERIAKSIELSTTLEGYETMNVSPSITGHIEHIYVEVGSRVAKGAMLVRMDQTQLNTYTDAFEQAKMDMASTMFDEILKNPKYKDVYFIQPDASVKGSHEYQVDGTHPDDHGYYMWSKSIEKPILKILKKYGIK